MAEAIDLVPKDANLHMRADLLNVAGRMGLYEFSGYVFEEWLPELQGDRGRRIIREMRDNDSVCSGILFAIEMLIRKAEWSCSPFDNSAQAKNDADFAYECINDMDHPFTDKLSEILSFLWFGWSYFEMNYKARFGMQPKGTDEFGYPLPTSRYNDGKFGWKDWAIRGQESLLRWEFHPNNDDLLGLWQIPPPDYQLLYVPYNKSLLFRTQVYKGNPEGRSCFRGSYISWLNLKHLMAIEGIGIERDLAGLPVIKCPPDLLGPDASPDQIALLAKLKQIATNIRMDEQGGIVFPLAYDDNNNEMYKLELLSTGGRRQINVNEVIERYSLRIAMALLADFILMGHEQVGSFALSDNKTGLFMAAIGSWLDAIAEVINSRAMPQLMLVNGRDPAKAPKLFHSDVQKTDITALGLYIQQIAPVLGDALRSPEVMKYLLDQGGLPSPRDGSIENPDMIHPLDEPPDVRQAEGEGTTDRTTTPQAKLKPTKIAPKPADKRGNTRPPSDHK